MPGRRQLLTPPADSIHEARPAAGEAIGRAGRSLLETILNSGAGQIAEPGTPGTASGDVRRRGRQPGRVRLPDRQLRIELPRSRRKDAGAAAPAFEGLRNGGETGAGMLRALLKAVSTRNCRAAVPARGESAGVPRSAVRRQGAEAGARRLEELLPRRWDGAELLAILPDGMRFGSQHVTGAAGVDLEGRKHALGIQPGAAENAAAVKDPPAHLRRHGPGAARRYRPVLDGAKALRAAIGELSGASQFAQRLPHTGCATSLSGRPRTIGEVRPPIASTLPGNKAVRGGPRTLWSDYAASGAGRVT